MKFSHETIEKNAILMLVLTLITTAVIVTAVMFRTLYLLLS